MSLSSYNQAYGMSSSSMAGPNNAFAPQVNAQTMIYPAGMTATPNLPGVRKQPTVQGPYNPLNQVNSFPEEFGLAEGAHLGYALQQVQVPLGSRGRLTVAQQRAVAQTGGRQPASAQAVKQNLQPFNQQFAAGRQVAGFLPQQRQQSFGGGQGLTQGFAQQQQQQQPSSMEFTEDYFGTGLGGQAALAQPLTPQTGSFGARQTGSRGSRRNSRGVGQDLFAGEQGAIPSLAQLGQIGSNLAALAPQQPLGTQQAFGAPQQFGAATAPAAFRGLEGLQQSGAPYASRGRQGARYRHNSIGSRGSGYANADLASGYNWQQNQGGQMYNWGYGADQQQGYAGQQGGRNYANNYAGNYGGQQQQGGYGVNPFGNQSFGRQQQQQGRGRRQSLGIF